MQGIMQMDKKNPNKREQAYISRLEVRRHRAELRKQYGFFDKPFGKQRIRRVTTKTFS